MSLFTHAFELNVWRNTACCIANLVIIHGGKSYSFDFFADETHVPRRWHMMQMIQSNETNRCTLPSCWSREANCSRYIILSGSRCWGTSNHFGLKIDYPLCVCIGTQQGSAHWIATALIGLHLWGSCSLRLLLSSLNWERLEAFCTSKSLVEQLACSLFLFTLFVVAMYFSHVVVTLIVRIDIAVTRHN